jgi:hypothetical protein
MKKVTAKMILELCTYSGKDVMVCKRALVKAEGDMSTAKKIVGKKYVCAAQTPPTPSKKERKPKKAKAALNDGWEEYKSVTNLMPVFQRGKKVFTIDDCGIQGVISIPDFRHVTKFSIRMNGNQLKMAISTLEEPDDEWS